MQQTPSNEYGVSLPLDIIVCPSCKGYLEHKDVDEKPHLFCSRCSLAYPIRSGIPVMLQDEAVVL
ncbi:MAG: Trm112 family protein [Desulfuromonadaceae bacterium]|nr:Trm112 family protein [Desulfuromonadaceae bacterium]